MHYRVHSAFLLDGLLHVRQVNATLASHILDTVHEHMVEVLKQPQFVPENVADQIVSIFADTVGVLAKVKFSDAAAFATAMFEYFTTSGKFVRDEIDERQTLNDTLEKKLTEALSAFQSSWTPEA